MLIVIDQPATTAEALAATRGTDGLGLVVVKDAGATVGPGGSDARGDARPGTVGGGRGPVMAVGSEGIVGTTSEAGTSVSRGGSAAIAMAAVGRAASVLGIAAGAELVVAGVGGGGPAGRTVRLEPAALPLGTGLLTGLGGGGPAGGPGLGTAVSSSPELGLSGDVVSEEDAALEPSLVSYSSSISCCEKGADPAAAVLLLEALCQAGHEPNAIACSAALSACEKGQRWTSALGMLRFMSCTGPEPDVVAFAAAAAACGAGQQWREATGIAAQMASASVQSNRILENSLISACEKPLQWRRAVDVLAAMRHGGPRPDVVSYSATLSAGEKSEEWRCVLQLFGEMGHASVARGLVSFDGALSACARKAQWSRGLCLLRELQGFHLTPNTITYTASVEACANHPVVVLDLLGEMRRSRCALDAVAYATAAAACDGSSNAGALLDWLLGCEQASLQLLQS
eukprot:s840_g3.t1